MAETLARLFRHAVSFEKPDAILTKAGGRYEPISSAELYRRVARLQRALRRAGIGRGDRVALLSENRWEWAAADFAMMTAGIVNVPLYPTLSAEQLHYMLEHSESKAVMVSTKEQLEKILHLWPRLRRLEGAAVFDPLESLPPKVTALPQWIGGEPLTADERREFEQTISSIEPHELASIIYTSGTTGVPKGVMLSHGNFASNVRDNGFDIRPDDVTLSFLPLSHVAERTADYAYFYNGATVAYAETVETVAENLREVRPAIVVAVPRFFEKMHARVMEAIEQASWPRRKLFEWALRTGSESAPYRLEGKRLPWGLRRRQRWAERLVLKKLRGRLGGRLRFFVSGAAPLARHLAEFFYAAGITICEAYGLTETSPVISANYTDDLAFGTVGRPIRNVEVKIAADGEILVRGPNIMQGYYKQPEMTSEVIIDGWLHTGDIGGFDENGRLRITDRKRDLLKTSGGKFIAPAPIENRILASPYVATAVVVAEGRRFPAALIVPHFEKLQRYARSRQIPFTSDRGLVERPEIRELLEKEVANACCDLSQYEKVKKIAILDRDLTMEDGEITPTMKVRRRRVLERYAARIEALYAE